MRRWVQYYARDVCQPESCYSVCMVALGSYCCPLIVVVSCTCICFILHGRQAVPLVPPLASLHLLLVSVPPFFLVNIGLCRSVRSTHLYLQ